MKKSLNAFACSALFVFCAAAGEIPPKSEYAIVNRMHLDGDGGWDYCTVDDATGRLFVSHGTEVQVVDVAAHSRSASYPTPKACMALRWCATGIKLT